MSKIRFVTPPYRLVTLTSDINNIKEIYSDDDELNRLLEAVKQNCLTRVVLGNVEKGKETPLTASCLRTTPERISVEEFDEIKIIQNPSEH
ncbi:hypothetical protein MZB69_22165 [Escherichia coli]|uniref:hypothetical protein n=1 Tax=Escherichia marmotae TaxID=1499973 RepID=UPI00220DDBA3|nr:hypothetical protein [Escherichia marmotae]MCQ5512833.1 hypothetical protein [Escherichia coli]MCQ5518012.1 hypothetical protein [Escherichia coli]MCQ5553200.1 hypothetical protein [Escherichia coli]MCQ5564462.1 hypothetical protein [Escherichia coli]MCQ5584680.1 hypothetical protein [Escherichia coli]